MKKVWAMVAMVGVELRYATAARRPATTMRWRCSEQVARPT